MKRNLLIIAAMLGAGCSSAPESTWFKGNLHTHSFWSDGDDFPETIAAWYVGEGYDFLAISDHNVIADAERWLPISKTHPRYQTYLSYSDGSPEGWVESRETDDSVFVRLKKYEEYASRFEEPGIFLMIRAEEVTTRFESKPVHINATNVAEYLEPLGGTSVVDVMQKNVDAILAQGERLNRPVMPHINHPNFVWGVRADELAQIDGERFFEVYNGHPSVNNEGDSLRMSMEKMWDVVNTIRLRSGKPLMFGIGTDDAHHFQEQAIGKANAGRGWVMVEADSLSARSIISAMEEGKFYASSGVVLSEVRFDGNEMTITVEAQEGVSYRIEFFGTMKGHELEPVEILDPESGELLAYRYSDEIGRLLQADEGPAASYTFSGEEMFVRARVTSSTVKDNPNFGGEFERAWTQPVEPVMTRY